jgi:predicted phage terminase large subunit-like protein
MILRPQPGAQERFLESSADIAIYGGAAGGGKSFALLLEPLRHVLTNPGFSAVYFRRTTTQVRNPGGLWDESMKIYSGIPGAEPLQQPLEWKFKKGGKIKFAHLEHETTVLEWQGSQVPFLAFDELTHFTRSQFWYLLSRNRSMCGVRPYVRATCNPDADSWVAELIAWWIDQGTGLPILSRSGVIRWFIRVSDALIWGDTREELGAAHEGCIPKSLTFIPARLDDNQALVKADPGYRANLMAQTLVERERLLGGNWKIRPSAGLYFQRSWCEVVDAVPAGLTICRGWDLAATPETGSNDPDWTSCTKIGRTPDKQFFVLDQDWLRGTPQKVQQLILNTASQDGKGITISIPQDPGQSGKAQAIDYIRLLAGYKVEATVESRNLGSENPTPSKQSAKITRFSPFSAQAEAGNVKILRGPWNTRWFDELEGFPEASHDDSADSTSRAFNTLTAAPAPARTGRVNFMPR